MLLGGRAATAAFGAEQSAACRPRNSSRLSLPEPSVEGGVEIAESEGVTTAVRASRKKASAASRAATYAKKKEANSLKKLGERSS